MPTYDAGYSSQNNNDSGNRDDSSDVALVQGLANYLRQNQEEKCHRNGMEQLVEVFLGDELTRLAASDSSSSITHDDDSLKVVEMMTSTTMTTTSTGLSRNDESEQLLLLLSQKDQFQKVLDVVHQAAVHNKNVAPSPTAIAKPKSSTTTSTSFSSLLDTNKQFQFNAERVTAEQILQCCSSSSQEINNDNEKLWKMVPRIDHLDDISYMWDDIRPLLVKQLQHRNYIPYLWNLTTDSPYQPDYVSIRYDLCLDIMNQISSLVTQKRREGKNDENDVHTSSPNGNYDDSSGCLSSSTSISSLWNTWHKIWCQFMSSTSLHALSEQDVDNMALQVWTTIVEDGNHTTGSSVVTSFGVLALIDPCATWFSRWIPQLSIDRVLQVLNKTQLLGFLWKKVTTMAPTKTNTTNNDTEIENDIISRIESACHIQALGMLQSILAVTRISRFPFYLLEKEEQRQEESQRQMIESYLQILSLLEIELQNNHHEERIMELCLQAIEVIIMGTKDSAFVIDTYGQLLSLMSSSSPQGIKQQLCYAVTIKVLFEKDWSTTTDRSMATASSPITPTTKATVLEMLINFIEQQQQQQQQQHCEEDDENASLKLRLCPYDKRDLDRIKMELVSSTNN